MYIALCATDLATRNLFVSCTKEKERKKRKKIKFVPFPPCPLLDLIVNLVDYEACNK